MFSALDRAALLAANVTDTATAAVSAAWPRSAAAVEIARLTEIGYTAGTTCELAFSLEFPEPETATLAIGDVRDAGFTVADSAKGFVTVRSSLPLRAWELAHATARLRRVASRHGGFATVIGPVEDPAQLPEELAHAPGRVAALQRATA